MTAKQHQAAVFTLSKRWHAVAKSWVCHGQEQASKNNPNWKACMARAEELENCRKELLAAMKHKA